MTKLTFTVTIEGDDVPLLYDESERGLAQLRARLDRHRIEVAWKITSAE